MVASAAALTTAACAADETTWNRYNFQQPKEIGSYDVSVTLGGEKAQRSWIRFEGRRLALSDIETKAGETKTVTFTARVKGPIAKEDKPTKEAPFPYTLDVTVVTDGPRPADPVVTPNPSARVIYVCGDSTVTDQQSEPWGSWGQALPLFFKQGVAVANFARSGLTTKTSWNQKRLERICKQLKKDDVVLIQFGHNDQKDKSLTPEANGGYEQFLNRYIDEVEKREGLAVLVTPVERERFNKSEQAPHTLTDYAEAVKRVAAARKVPVLDLNEASYTLYGTLGHKKVRELFVGKDKTHHNIYGATMMARFIANDLVAKMPALAPFLREEGKGFDPKNPPAKPFVPACGVTDLTRPEGDVGNKY